MEAYLTQQILHALTTADLPKIVAYGLIFFLLWRELRGLRLEVHKLRDNVSESFKNGEKRFEKIEKQNLFFEHKIMILDTAIKELKGSSNTTKEVQQ